MQHNFGLQLIFATFASLLSHIGAPLMLLVTFFVLLTLEINIYDHCSCVSIYGKGVQKCVNCFKYHGCLHD